ncbi:hypothetical protein [Clostridium tunisiense]|uniref:hypothetical protein n=1 Tax=Clostridium tunisiense TaxID=219748 RepID=UPI00178C777B|nr:hypothetical protein [Clostridium tunisiense]
MEGIKSMKNYFKKNKATILISLVILLYFFLSVDIRKMKMPTVDEFIYFLGMVLPIVFFTYKLLKYGKKIIESDNKKNKQTKMFIVFFFGSVFISMISVMFKVLFFE